jgi:hypothetical protein
MKSTLRLPMTLAFVVGGAVGAALLGGGACGGDDGSVAAAAPHADAADSCEHHGNLPVPIDAGPEADATQCPICANPSGVCPVGCRPVG